jgi:hypothetical protein
MPDDNVVAKGSGAQSGSGRRILWLTTAGLGMLAAVVVGVVYLARPAEVSAREVRDLPIDPRYPGVTSGYDIDLRVGAGSDYQRLADKVLRIMADVPSSCRLRIFAISSDGRRVLAQDSDNRSGWYVKEMLKNPSGVDYQSHVRHLAEVLREDVRKSMAAVNK